MSLFQKITDKRKEREYSRELKRIEIENLFKELFAEAIPDFQFIMYKNDIFYFSKNLEYKNFIIFEAFQIRYSSNEKNFSCSISSCFNKTKQFSYSYNSGDLNPHLDLAVLVKQAGSKTNNAYTFNNDKMETITRVVEKVVDDYKNYGLQYLSDRVLKLQEDKLLNSGLEFISQLTANPEILKLELEKELEEAKKDITGIKHPIFDELKNLLIKKQEETNINKVNIPRLAYELFQLYWDNLCL